MTRSISVLRANVNLELTSKKGNGYTAEYYLAGPELTNIYIAEKLACHQRITKNLLLKRRLRRTFTFELKEKQLWNEHLVIAMINSTFWI